jgi:hypothetical protein
MTKTIVATAFILFALSMAGQAQSTSASGDISGLVGQLADAYKARDMGRLDAVHPYRRSIILVIENSLAEDDAKNRFVRRSFTSLATAQRWLHRRERADSGDRFPTPQRLPLKICHRGVCTFDLDGGILHNQLYLQKVTYGSAKGHLYFMQIFLLDGD